MKPIHIRAKEFLYLNGMSQSKLAGMIGCNPTYICNILAGKKNGNNVFAYMSKHFGFERRVNRDRRSAGWRG